MGSLYFGIATAAESAALGVMAALAFVWASGRMSRELLRNCFVSTARIRSDGEPVLRHRHRGRERGAGRDGRARLRMGLGPHVARAAAQLLRLDGAHQIGWGACTSASPPRPRARRWA